MKKFSLILVLILTTALLFALSVQALAADASAAEPAAEESAANPVATKATSAAIVVAIVGAAGAIGMAIAIGKSVSGMSRQPEAAGRINSAMMLGLVFIETIAIYALIVAILIIFVL